MKAARIVRPNEPLAVEELDIPQVSGDEVLIKVTAAGVCHSDLHLWEGGYEGAKGTFMKVEDRGVKFPLTPGHEVAGIVEKSNGSIKEGESVLVFPWIGEGTCPACIAGSENLCDKPTSLGIYQDGGYAQYMVVPNHKHLVPIGDMDPSEASSLACSGLTAYTATKNASLTDDDFTVIIGAGGLGLMAVQIIKATHKSKVAIVDIDNDRLEKAKSLGADFIINPKTQDLVSSIKDLTSDLGADVVIDFVNSSITAPTDLELLRRRGRLVLVGLFGGSMEITLPVIPLRAYKIIGSYTGSYGDLKELVELAQSGKVKSVVTKKFSLNEANEALGQLKEGKIVGRAVINP